MLWYKLIKLRVRGQILKVIKSKYEHIKSLVDATMDQVINFHAVYG